jgi:hypothetical protein
MTVVFSQAAPFTGAAYQYLRGDDALPAYREIADEHDRVCRVKLFQPFSRWTFYLVAATEYDGIVGPVVTGYCISPLGPDCDEFGDQALTEIAAVRVHGVPPERDLHFEPVRLSELEAHIAPARPRAVSGRKARVHRRTARRPRAGARRRHGTGLGQGRRHRPGQPKGPGLRGVRARQEQGPARHRADPARHHLHDRLGPRGDLPLGKSGRPRDRGPARPREASR